MSFLRFSMRLRSSLIRPTLTAPHRTLQTTTSRFASQDYGSGEGNPVGEKPQEQGKNPREDLEHPGPPAPNVGQAKESSSGGSQSKDTQQSSKSESTTKSSGGSGGSKKGTKGAQPKILNVNPPGEDDPAVKKHNEEMDQRAEKAHEQVSNEDAEKDKVSKGFWSGQGGRDKEP